ncbi:MAG: BMC domain-containing protein [Acidobacteria bacterium]|nr:BMC domain-containing protein [Acidobacteriota bacterium]
MKKHPAIAIIEFGDIPVGMHATDAMLKKAPIGSVRCGTVSRGRYLTVIGGTPASVEESLGEGLRCGETAVLDHLLLADVHPQVYDAILGQRKVGGRGALAIIETDTVASNVRAAELALKGTAVDLIEIRLADSGLSGKGVSLYQGELHDIEAAIGIVVAFLKESGAEARYRIIPSPHEALTRQVEISTYFGASRMLELEGEDL